MAVSMQSQACQLEKHAVPVYIFYLDQSQIGPAVCDVCREHASMQGINFVMSVEGMLYCKAQFV